jgi:Fic family protein
LNKEVSMGSLVRRRWEGDDAGGLSRRDRRSCEYEAFVPDTLTGRRFVLDGEVAADVADAERAIARLDAEAAALVDTEALARLLLRAESVASSRIEGLHVGGRRLLRAEAARGLGEAAADVTAAEVLANIDAMVYATDASRPGVDVTVAVLLEVHRRLLDGGPLAGHGGVVRTVQNWIGGSGYNPCAAVFVPPPPEAVPELLDDLCAFCNADDLPPVAQAAIAHAQFETIHPFIDGNGRTGRALVYTVLRRRGLARQALPPVSLILATWSADYIAALQGTHVVGDADAPRSNEAVNRWVALFAAACVRAVEDAVAFEARVRELDAAWRARLERVRADSTADLLLRRLPGSPLLTVASAAELTGRSVQATNEAITRLVDAGVLVQTTVGRRNRAFEAPDVIDAFTAFERRLASPAGETRASPPVRPVPHRR